MHHHPVPAHLHDPLGIVVPAAPLLPVPELLGLLALPPVPVELPPCAADPPPS
jgi:hypothetical protein